MEYRSLSLVACLIALSAISSAAPAADGGASAELQHDWQQRQEKALAAQAEAKARQTSADRRLEQKNAECHSRFQVNACLEEARHEHMTVAREAQRLENQGKAEERQIKKEQLAEKDKRRADEAPQRDADLAARQADTAAARQASEAELAERQAGKAKKAEEGARRKAAEAEKQRKKIADHEARVAKKMQGSGRPADDAEKK